MQHLTSITQLTKAEIKNLINKATQIKKSPQEYSDSLKGKILATLFFEPSTRTLFSFESAALRLGAKTLGFADAQNTSVKKGETLEDTIKVISGFADIIAMRHFEPGAADRAAAVSEIPIINAGDGTGEHPTQALLDFFTIDEIRGSLENLKIAFVGDLKFGRTVHSLSQGMEHFNPTIYFISPKELQIPKPIKERLENRNIKFSEHETWENIADQIDVLYMTRVQAERFEDKQDYERLKASYILNKEAAKLFKDDCLFMHPLPRVGEIDPNIDDDKRSIYFKEAHNGVWMRMAILLYLINN